MVLTLDDVAHLLCVSREVVRVWIQGEGLPAHHVGRDLRLNRTEVLEWAMARGIPLSTDMPDGPGDDEPLSSLVEALRAGGVHGGIAGRDKREVLRSAVETLHLREKIDRDSLLAVLLARESLGSTGVGDGIAIPHVRNPIVIHLAPPAVSLCFLGTPVDFDAFDGKPVHTLFLMTSPSVRIHQHLLSRLSVALRHPELRAVLAAREEPERILEAFRRIEKALPAPWGGGTG